MPKLKVLVEIEIDDINIKYVKFYQQNKRRIKQVLEAELNDFVLSENENRKYLMILSNVKLNVVSVGVFK